MLEVNFTPFPILQTERLVLRRLSKLDAGEFFNLRSDNNVMQYIGRPLAKTLDDVYPIINMIEDSVINNNGITWAITLKGKNDLVGTIGLWRIEKEHYRAEIGYLIAPSLQGKRLMQEAMIAVLDYGFKKMKLHSIEGIVSPNNAASIKLLERNNFVREAYFKENYFFNNKFLDTAVYSLVNINY